MQYQFHPVANIFPLMLESEIAELAKDIEQNGLREEIWLDPDDQIIDGRNRYVACQRAKVEPTFRTWDGDGDLIKFVVSLNLHRRHLTENQRGMVAAQIANMSVGNPNLQKPIVGIPTITQADAAKMLNVSRDTVIAAKKVLSEGTAEEIDAVKNDEVKASALADDIRKGVPPEERGKNKTKVRNTWTRVAVPAGKTVEQHARDGLRMQTEGKNTNDISRALGVGQSTWAAMRNVVLVADRTDLSEREQQTAQAALVEMNTSGQAAAAHEMVEPIVARIWGNSDARRTRLDRAEERRIEAFDRAYGLITQACLCAAQVEIPHLSRDRTTEIAAELTTAIQTVRDFRKRILEIHQ